MVGLYVSDMGQNPAQHVEYVGFDPNVQLYNGYQEMMSSAMASCHSLVSITKSSAVTAATVAAAAAENTITQISALQIVDKSLHTTFDIRAQPFEKEEEEEEEASFDMAFTSPPFFDYEVYNESTNPAYTNWITEFYEPLFQRTARLLKPGSFFAVYLDDTSAGSIRDFLMTTVEQICALRFDHTIGFRGIYSGKTREILVYRRCHKET
jgi:hypothetical protein